MDKNSGNEMKFEYIEDAYAKLKEMYEDDQIFECIALVKDIGKLFFK
jgi:hypothetical protein